MSKKFKVINNNSFTVGIRLENPSRDVNIRANTFVFMNEEDILYTNSVSGLFERGILTVEDEEILHLMGYTEKNPNAIDKDEIAKLLELPNQSFKRRVSQINERHAIQKIIRYIVENEVDINLSKAKLINDAFGVDIHEIIKQESESKETS